MSKKRNTDPLSSVLRKHASVVITDATRTGGLTVAEVLAWREWFNARQKILKSSGGRPTNPNWTLKRQVYFSQETWDGLVERAKICSGAGNSLGPGQLAAFLLEDALREVDRGPVHDSTIQQPSRLPEDLDPQFRDWNMPAPFAATAA